MEKRIVLPYAPILVESTRSIGYSFESALADIIDNSLSKGATRIDVCFSSLAPQYVAVVDNGIGMDADELQMAMRYGSRSSLDDREKGDLGRFGLGLKTASLSQCRKLTVLSKKNGQVHAASWDIDYIIDQNDWALIWYEKKDMQSIPFYDQLEDLNSGTVVLWQVFDRIKDESADPQKVFDEKIERARSHISLVFHRFVNPENNKDKVKIYFNNDPVDVIDPFLLDNPATQPLPEQIIRIENSIVKVKPYVLPFASKLSVEDRKKLGQLNDLRQNQGFYVYRNKRLIIWGTWFRLLKVQELNKLARIKVDIPNTLDSLWDIDIKKSKASIPDVLKKRLIAAVMQSAGRSERVYQYRGRSQANDNLFHVWEPISERGKFQYRINKKYPIYEKLRGELNEAAVGYLDSFLKVLEDSFPYTDIYYRLAKDENSVVKKSLEYEEVYQIAEDTINSLKEIGGDVKAFIYSMDKMDVFVPYPDVIKDIRKAYEHE